MGTSIRDTDAKIPSGNAICPYCFEERGISVFDLDIAVNLGAVELWKWAAQHKQHGEKEQA